MNVSNSLTEVEGFKKEVIVDEDAATFTERSDGKRDVTISVSIGQPKEESERTVQKELFNKIITKTSTTTVVYHGKVFEETETVDNAEVTTKYFQGWKCVMKIASYNRDYPDSEDITGTIEFQGAGTAPVEIEKTAVASLATE